MKKVVFSFIVAAAQIALCADTELLYSAASPEVGPFPSDLYTAADSRQKTGRRINFPPPATCGLQPTPSACLDTALLNELDGFSVEPRIRLCFSQPVNAATLDDGVSLIALNRRFQAIGIERVFVDPASKCAFMRPSAVLEPGERYALFVTDRVRDAQGKPVKASRTFKDMLGSSVLRTVSDLLGGVLGGILGGSDRVIGATVFTTMSATNWVERARAVVNDPMTPSIAEPIGPPSGIPMNAVSSIKWLAETTSGGPLTPNDIRNNLPGVGSLAFGIYLSPNFIATEGPAAGTIPNTPTNLPIQPQMTPVINPQLPGFVPIGYNLWLPSIPKPPSGYPVVIYGHGLTDSRFGAPNAIASTLAQQGFATLAINIFGHGFGPNSMVELTVAGTAVQLPAPGRGIALPGNPAISPLGACILPGPIAGRDCARQTAVDMFALIRAITTTNGLFGQVDPSRIFYVGQSFGASVGSLVAALEPGIRGSVMNVPPGSSVDTVRLAQERPLAQFYLGTRTPSLLNLPFDPGHPANFDFNDNFVFRGKAPVVNSVPGAPAIQEAFEVAEWLNMPASPLAFVPRLKNQKVLYQFAKGDEEVPNPTNSAFIRAAGGQSSSRYLRFDIARGIASGDLPPQPHRFLANPGIFSTPAQLSIALAAQRQVAGFFASNGNNIPDANAFLTAPFAGVKLFEIPATLPEDLNFIRKQPSPPSLP